MLDMTESIAPKSDQLNAEDLLTGPRTFTIAEVKRGSAEQPIDVHLVEFPGRPFKPSKTVRRIMVGAWGADASTYAGRRLTLYRDPAVRFGGQDVGGIRVSHMSGLEKPMTLALTVTRGKRAPYVVRPLADEQPAPLAVTGEQVKELVAALGKVGLTEKEAALEYLTEQLGRPITATKQLTRDEATTVLGVLAQSIDPAEPAPWDDVIPARPADAAAGA
jgi:hypothetical protein